MSEIALSLVLLIGAGLLMKSFLRLQSGEFGFDTHDILSLRVQLPNYKYPEADQRRSFFDQLDKRLNALPQVESAGAVMFLPLSGWQAGTGFNIEGHPAPAPGEEPQADYQVATTNYFQTLGIRLISGRYFTEQDRENTPRVAIIDEALANRYWSGEVPVGKYLTFDGAGGQVRCEIVGVVAHVKSLGLEERSNPTLYLPFLQAPESINVFRDQIKRGYGEPDRSGPKRSICSR